MPYTTNVNVWDFPNALAPVSARLWMLWGSSSGPQQSLEEEVSPPTATGAFTVQFVQGPDYLANSRSIGLSLQRQDLVATDEGWWFRSGGFDTLPNQNIELVLANPVLITPPDVTAAIPPMPMPISSLTTVTSATAMLLDAPPADGYIDLSATGTTMEAPLVGPVGFTYRLEFRLVPTTDIAAGEQKVFDIVPNGKGTITFFGAGTPASAIQAILLNAISGLIVKNFFPVMRRRLELGINAGVLSTVASMIAPGTTTMPPGIVVSVRRCTTSSAGVKVLPAMGAYDGVFSKLPPASTGNGGICALVTAAVFLPSLNLDAFRSFRDLYLARTSQGRELTEMYYRHASEVSRLLVTRRQLREEAAVLLPEIATLISRRQLPTTLLRERCETFLKNLASLGSTKLRFDIASALRQDYRLLYFH